MKSPPPGHDVHRDTALLALDLGLPPGVPREDGTKMPEGRWKKYQTTPATREEVIAWYRRGRTGNALFTGYGGVECLEWEDAGLYGRFKEAAIAFGLGDELARIEAGYCESSPGGGIHWLYRCSKVEGNTKLAERPAPAADDPNARETLIETRGVGGFIIIAPSNGKVHPSGRAYRLLSGGLETIATIEPDIREAFHSLARTFDEIPVEPESATKPPHPEAQVADGDGFPRQGLSPGDDFNARAKLADIIEPFGWERVHVSGGVEYWRRPGKEEGWSATWGKTKGFRVFTTSTSLEAKSHSLLYAYCKLKHQGDFKSCIKDLAEQGYGTWIGLDGQERTNPVPKDWRARSQGSSPSRNYQQPSKPDASSPVTFTLITTPAAKVQAMPVEFLVPGVIPRGKLVMLVGLGGMGKGMFWTALAADLTTGRAALGLGYKPPRPVGKGGPITRWSGEAVQYGGTPTAAPGTEL
jgi:hypothetical protein